MDYFKHSLQPIEIISNAKQQKIPEINGLEGEYSKTFISHWNTSGLLSQNPKSLSFGTRKTSHNMYMPKDTKCKKESQKINDSKSHESKESIFERKAKYKYNIRRMELLNYHDSLH